jgi:hypothetical protein
MESFPFADPPNVAVITTVGVLDGEPILLVTHDADDGGWQFLGTGPNTEENARVVALVRIYRIDESVGELADLPLGWAASRPASGFPWKRYANPR